MAAGSRDRPPMLAPGRYPQWRSRPTTILVHAVEATNNSLTVPEHTTVETPSNMSPKNKAHFLEEKEAIHLILTGIGDDIYSTVDACQTAQEMWEVNVQFLQQLQPEWSRVVTIVKQQHKLDEVSYHKLFDILKQHQNEVNELRAEKLARNANPLALRTVNVAAVRENVGSKMLLCRQAEQGVLLQAEQHDWLADTDEEVDEQELEEHYSYMAKIQEVPNADSGTNSEPVEQVQNNAEYNVFSNELQHSEQSESVSNTCLVETNDNNVTPDSPNMCEDDIQNDQNDVESDDERVALANLIANLKLDVDENKKIQKQLKKANTTLAQELRECKAILAKTSKSLGESISVRDSCLVVLQTKQTVFEKYKAFNNRTVDYDKLERKLNEALEKIAHKDIVIREGLKTKAYELSVVKEKHDELMKYRLLTKSHYKGLLKQKMKVITDLKLREEHDIEKILSIKKQINFLNEIVYKRSQSIQTIHMMAPKVSTYNGRPTFANPRYLKQAQYEIPCLYAFPYEQNTHANRLIPDGEETLALERESRSKLNKDTVHLYDYTKLNSIYEIFKPPTQEYETQLAYVNEIRRKMWQKSFVKSKPNIYKNVGFLPVSKSISKSRQAYNVMKNNINHFKQIIDDAWTKHSKDLFHAPTAPDMEILIQTCLMPLAIKTQSDSLKFVHELKQEMHADLKYVESLKKEIDELQSEKAEFSDMYDVILHDCLSKDVMCSYLQSLSDLDMEILIQTCLMQYF
nr:hypothetical protein [Tanacetum cinerariifolium]